MAISLAEIAKTETDVHRKGIILTIMDEEPVFGYMGFNSIGGLAYAYNKTEKLPLVKFRKLNEAHSESSGVVNREVEALKICGFDSDTDRQEVKAYGSQFIKSRNTLKTHAMATSFVQYFLYGNSGARTASAYDDADAFDGIITRVTSGQAVDAGGTSSTAGSTVFAVRFGDPYCVGLQTDDIEIQDLGEIDEKPVFRTRLDWATGFAIMHGKSVAIIKNLDTTKTLTVAMMDELLGKIKGRKPSVYIGSDRSIRQLKADAFTNYNITLPVGLDYMGKPVETWGGVPFLVSDAVIDTEDNTA